MEEKVYSIEELAKLLGMSYTHIYGMVKQGLVNYSWEEIPVGKRRGRHTQRMVVTTEEVLRQRKLFHIDETLYTLNEMAKKLKLTRSQTLGQYVRDGRIKSYTLPTGRVVIPESEVLKLEKKMKYSKKTYQIGKLL